MTGKKWRWNIAKNLRINKEIKSDSVRVVSAEGEQLGVMSIADALAGAEKENLDLVEVAPGASPPVCRVMDYGKFRYQQSKKQQLAKKSQTTIQLKEVRFRPKTDEHDLEVKFRHVKRFLEQNNKVKLTMMFRGREIVYRDKATKIMEEIASKVDDLCVIDQRPKLEGRRMIMVLSPKK